MTELHVKHRICLRVEEKFRNFTELYNGRGTLRNFTNFTFLECSLFSALCNLITGLMERNNCVLSTLSYCTAIRVKLAFH